MPLRTPPMPPPPPRPSQIANKAFRTVFLFNRNSLSDGSTAPSSNDPAVLTSPQVEGPFHIASPFRRNIVEDRVGIPLTLTLEVMDVDDQVPIPNAIVEIWHCDAEGRYSGYPEESAHDFTASLKFTGVAGMLGKEHVDPVNDKLFLRGAQQTDARGRVVFDTIFPGWYEPRAAHIHVKVIVNNAEVLTSQLYFNQKLCDQIYDTIEPYKAFGKNPYSVQNDLALRDLKAIDGVILELDGTPTTALTADVRVGLKAEPADE